VSDLKLPPELHEDRIFKAVVIVYFIAMVTAVIFGLISRAK